MLTELDEALADLAAMSWHAGALLPADERWLQMVRAIRVVATAKRPLSAARAALRGETGTLDELRELREWRIARPVMAMVALAHGLTVKALFSRRKDRIAVVAKDMLKWELLAEGLTAEGAGRVLACHGYQITRGAARHAKRTRASGRVLRKVVLA